MANAYTEEYSGGVTKDGSGYFSSMILVITSESAIHFPSPSFYTGTFPSGLISKNLSITDKSKSFPQVTI